MMIHTVRSRLSLPGLALPGLARTSCALAVLLAPAAASTEALTVDEVLVRANEALGWQRVADQAGAVRIRGGGRLLGTDAEQTDLFDGRGRWLQTFEGPLPAAGGSDGRTTWAVDWTGTPNTLEFGELRDAHLSSAFLYGSWVAAPELLEFESVTEEGGLLLLPFRPVVGNRDATPEGVLRLDAATHLPASLTWNHSHTAANWTFVDYRDHDGYRFPARLTMVQGDLTQGLETWSVEFLEAVDDALFAPRLELPEDARFDADKGPVLELKRAPTGHLLVKPKLDGRDLGWFIFDTGAGTNCISTAVAGRLGGEPFGEIHATGVGGTVTAHFYGAKSLELGPMTLESPILLGLDLSFLNAPFGVEVGGILGYELLARCVAEYDQDEPRISLHDPATYTLPEAGVWEEVTLFGRHPCVQATFEGHTGLFKIDTGAAGDTVTMHAPIVAEFELLEGRETQAGQAGGVGGTIGVREGELASFELGGHQFGPIPASFATEDMGAFGEEDIWGNLGGILFEPFVLVFDYQHQRMGFVLK